MPESIILLGPMQAGKSTVGRLLANALQMPFCDLPAMSWEYWKAAGFDNERCRALTQQEGVDARVRYLSPFEVLTLKRGLQDHPGSIIEVSAPQTVQEEPELTLRVREALAPYPNIFLLLPTPDQVLHGGACREWPGEARHLHGW